MTRERLPDVKPTDFDEDPETDPGSWHQDPNDSMHTPGPSLAFAHTLLAEQRRAASARIPHAALVVRYPARRGMTITLSVALGLMLGLAISRIQVRRVPYELAAECPPCPTGQTCNKGICVKAASSLTAETCPPTIEQLILEFRP